MGSGEESKVEKGRDKGVFRRSKCVNSGRIVGMKEPPVCKDTAGLSDLATLNNTYENSFVITA